MSVHVESNLHQMYGEEDHEYINRKLKGVRRLFLLSLVYYQSPCKVSWESNLMLYSFKLPSTSWATQSIEFKSTQSKANQSKCLKSWNQKHKEKARAKKYPRHKYPSKALNTPESYLLFLQLKSICIRTKLKHKVSHSAMYMCYSLMCLNIKLLWL